MIAKDQEPEARIAFDAPVGLGPPFLRQQSVQTLLHAGTPLRRFNLRSTPSRGKKKAAKVATQLPVTLPALAA
jgi:hypothetical protein